MFNSDFSKGIIIFFTVFGPGGKGSPSFSDRAEAAVFTFQTGIRASLHRANFT